MDIENLTSTKENCAIEKSFIPDNDGKITYSDVADFFLAFANEFEEPITNLKLQKLVYYAQAWYLANYGKSLFDADFEAWVHGPIIPALYYKYKIYSFKPIIEDLSIEDIKNRIDKDIFEYLNEVAEVYMPRTGYEMELMAHRELPWIAARKGFEPDQSCHNIISKESMRQYYGEKIKD